MSLPINPRCPSACLVQLRLCFVSPLPIGMGIIACNLDPLIEGSGDPRRGFGSALAIAGGFVDVGCSKE